MLSLIKIKDIHQCEDTDHVYAIVRTGPRATHVVRVGDLVPAGTMLVTPVIEHILIYETRILSLQVFNILCMYAMNVNEITKLTVSVLAYQ